MAWRNATGFEQPMAQEVSEPSTIARIGLVAWDGFDMTGMHKHDCQEPFEDVEDRLPIHPRTLNGPMGTARLDKPSRQAQYIIRHGGKRATFLLVLVEEACYDGLGVHVDTTATLIH